MATASHLRSIYRTARGSLFNCSIEEFLSSKQGERARGKIDLIFTSPPFPLTREKRYGNLKGREYIRWLGGLAKPLGDLLSDGGSLVIEIGNAWEPGRPVQSLVPLRALMRFAEAGKFLLCQEFIVYNPARLPSPIQWVNVERIRVKDSFTRIWWLSRTDRPRANNREVLKPYSAAMRRLLRNGTYNSGSRPSEHSISPTAFNNQNSGAIPPNVLLDIGDVWNHGDLLVEGNTRDEPKYLSYCRENGLPVHPARIQQRVPEFFVSFLTRPGDVVFDPFAGSNTTGRAAESLERRWIGVERDLLYSQGSFGRFDADAKARGGS